MDLIKQESWNEAYEKLDNNASIPQSTPLIEWIQYASSVSQKGNCLEIGCYPGGYTNEFGKLGHEINGIDLTPRITELNQLFQLRKYKVGAFLQKDFFDFVPEKKFNIVFSIGFIEHFRDYKSVIAQHCELVNNDGILLIAVPNFRGSIQYFLHKIFDNENLKMHNIASMNPVEWKNVLENNNFEILKQGYIGGFDFWMGNKERNYLQIAIRRILMYIVTPFLQKFLIKPSATYSPFMGIIAKKRS
jgi:2-polyprenyl-3-methyl-5-hydroxy-6-metoxy-1,4-benzoquinol methylase